jgi:hypothetical protein
MTLMTMVALPNRTRAFLRPPKLADGAVGSEARDAASPSPSYGGTRHAEMTAAA